MNYGDICRATCTAPARYVGEGLCLWVSAQDNGLMVSEAALATGGEEKLPLPTDLELQAARAMQLHLTRGDR